MATLSRRDFARLAAAASLAPTSLTPLTARADSPRPVIIAEGGAAEERIEDTRSALDLAINQGCDFIQVDLAPTKDGALVARRDHEISASTNVADRPEFADRKTEKTVDGKQVTGWFAEDFTLAELTSLTCRERLPDLRPQLVRLDGKEPILSLADVLQIARVGCVRTARTIGVCLGMRNTRYFADLDMPIVDRLVAQLGTEGYVAEAAAVWVQCAQPEALAAFGRVSPIRRMQIIESGDGSPGAADAGFAAMTSRDGLAKLRGDAEAIAPDQDLLFDPAAALFPAPTTLALDAHAAGLQVFSRTARAQNAFLPSALRRGSAKSKGFQAARGDVDKLLLSLFANGVDGVATDLPAAAVKARAAAIDAIRRGRGGQHG